MRGEMLAGGCLVGSAGGFVGSGDGQKTTSCRDRKGDRVLLATGHDRRIGGHSIEIDQHTRCCTRDRGRHTPRLPVLPAYHIASSACLSAKQTFGAGRDPGSVRKMGREGVSSVQAGPGSRVSSPVHAVFLPRNECGARHVLILGKLPYPKEPTAATHQDG